MAWQIKRKPEDFVVREILEDETRANWKEKISLIHGKGGAERAEKKKTHLWFTLKKRNLDFFTAIDMLAKKLNIKTKSISHAGTKDKRAVTYQTLSVPISLEKDIKNLKIKELSFSECRYRNRPVKLGDHSGNWFRITVRNIDKKEIEDVKKRLEEIRRTGLINFFGPQRFGVERQNHVIGKQMLSGNTRVLKKYKDVPKTLRMLFVHAYQSWIWNETAKRLPTSKIWIPLVGYKTRLEDYPESAKIISAILLREGIRLPDFRIKSAPELSCEGEDRVLVVKPKGLKYSWLEDNLNKGKKKLILEFELPPGNYGTELVRQIDPRENNDSTKGGRDLRQKILLI